MRYSKIIIFFFLLAFFLVMCTSEGEKDVGKEKIEDIKSNIAAMQKIISDSLYPTNIIYDESRLMIKIKTALPEMYYENKLNAIRERAIFLIRHKIEKVDTVWINFDIKELEKEPLTVYYDRSRINRVVQVESNDKTQYDFKSYILKHLDGEKLFKFASYLVAIKTANPEYNVSDDYIQMLFLLIDENRGTLKDAHIRQILVTLRNLIMTDQQGWKDFNPEDVNYFLDYKGL